MPNIILFKPLPKLNIANNSFENFPSNILKLQNLRTLWLNKNNFKDFPTQEILVSLKKLKAVYCFGIAKNTLDNLNKDYLVLTSKRGNSIRFVEELMVNPGGENKLIIGMNKETKSKINKNRIFISYSHQDDKWRQRVEVFLKALQNEKKMLNEEVLLDFWSDKRIKASQEWEKEIAKVLNEAYIAILIISAEFFASEYITTKELPPLLENAEKHGTKIISLIAGPCRFKQNKLISKFQAVNEPSMPLSNATPHEQDNVFLNLSNVIADYIY